MKSLKFMLFTIKFFRSKLLNSQQTELREISHLKMAKDEMIRSVGVISGIGLTAGTMIGSGIFMSPGDVLESSGIISHWQLIDSPDYRAIGSPFSSYCLTLF